MTTAAAFVPRAGEKADVGQWAITGQPFFDRRMAGLFLAPIPGHEQPLRFKIVIWSGPTADARHLKTLSQKASSRLKTSNH